ncbi:hypothetical protein [Myxococcus qinghaiensis]|uniref:hypothetical protein n=1 Tax=Myxococcus qinghaiensis TaxID=2906758 RepID=UPI0020A7D640|nr:hypothetical protein [Myxococcus qinghaiensis]
MVGKFGEILKGKPSGSLQLEVVEDNVRAAQLLANALKNHPSSEIPTNLPGLDNALQGNLSEFLAWELGEQHWLLFDRAWSWAPNAENPWRNSSDPGIDILAILTPDAELKLLVFEVKSSIGDGVALIAGVKSSLRTDFESLFRGAVQGRLACRVGRVLSSLKYHKGRADLIPVVKDIVGKNPASSPKISLVGLLICSQLKSAPNASERRQQAFEELSRLLRADGWVAQQVMLRCIETPSFSALLKQAISEVVNGPK